MCESVAGDLKINRQYLPLASKQLSRHRIMKLFDRGIKHSLFTVVAAPGHGKTHEAAGYFKNAALRLAWTRATKLDNLPSHFWSKLTEAFSYEMPLSAKKIGSMEFPNTLAKMDAFTRAMAEEVYSGPMVVMAVDDFDKIVDNEVLYFFEYLVDMELENFCLLLICRKQPYIVTPNEKDVFRITQEDLRFTREELQEFLAGDYGNLPAATLDRIYKDTEGWPLLIYMLSLQNGLASGEGSYSLGHGMEKLNALYGREFFLRYDDEIKRLLIKLSLLNSFTLEIIADIGECDLEKASDILLNNVFVHFNHATGEYVLNHMYRDFLALKQALIPAREKCRVYGVAAERMERQGNLLNSVEYYEMAGLYDRMLMAIVRFIGLNFTVTRVHGEFFWKKINALPEEVSKSNPLSDYIRVCLYIQSLQPQKALEILFEMEKRLLDDGSDKAKKMLGEVYERMAGIHMMLTKECFMDYYKKAYQYIPEGSNLKNKRMLRYLNISNLSGEDYSPGSVKRMERVIHDGFKYMNAVENNCSGGYQYLFSTEAAYAAFDFERATLMAYRALRDSLNTEAYDTACNAYFMLAQIACMKGDYGGMLDNVQNIGRLLDDTGVQGLESIREYAAAWLELTMGQLQNVPSWMIDAQFRKPSMMPLVIGREETLYADYLYQKGKYGEMLAGVENIKGIHNVKGWGDSIHATILQALCYFKMKKPEKAVDTLWEAYNITYANGIITHFVERASAMRSLIGHVRQDKRYPFSEEWLDDIYRKSSYHAKRLSAMKKEHIKHNSLALQIRPVLTNREMDVLIHLSSGKNRDEIAYEFGISVNTVKTTIAKIYNKLGAMNRVDAVRIAAEMGLLN